MTTVEAARVANSVGMEVVTFCAKVNFILKYSYFDRLHKSIDRLPIEVLHKIMPETENDYLTANSSVHCHTNVDPYAKQFVSLDGRGQMFALHTILQANRCKAPVLIVGSFGTGKTRLLARTAYQLHCNNKRHRILVCAHHQKSVDTFIENYFGEILDSDRVVRLVPNKEYKIINEKFHKYYKTIEQLCNDNLPKIVVTTYSSSFQLLKYKGLFTHILLDEGAQTREPESIIPLCLAKRNTQIVITGDHKQVC